MILCSSSDLHAETLCVLGFSVVVVGPSYQNALIAPQLGLDCFLPNLLQLIIRQSPYRSTLQSSRLAACLNSHGRKRNEEGPSWTVR